MSLPHTIFALILLAVGGGLAWLQGAEGSPATAAGDEPGDDQDLFARRQPRRWLIAVLTWVVAAAVFGGQYLHSPSLLGIYWCVVLALGVAIGVLGVQDFRASQDEIERQMKDLLEERSRFTESLARQEQDQRRREQRSGNGAP